jgi:hypothetical protein
MILGKQLEIIWNDIFDYNFASPAIQVEQPKLN